MVNKCGILPYIVPQYRGESSGESSIFLHHHIYWAHAEGGGGISQPRPLSSHDFGFNAETYPTRCEFAVCVV